MRHDSARLHLRFPKTVNRADCATGTADRRKGEPWSWCRAIEFDCECGLRLMRLGSGWAILAGVMVYVMLLWVVAGVVSGSHRRDMALAGYNAVIFGGRLVGWRYWGTHCNIWDEGYI